jgi:hypothetical protein
VLESGLVPRESFEVGWPWAAKPFPAGRSIFYAKSQMKRSGLQKTDLAVRGKGRLTA